MVVRGVPSGRRLLLTACQYLRYRAKTLAVSDLNHRRVFGNRCRLQGLLAAPFTSVPLGLTQRQSLASEWCVAETPSIIVAMFVSAVYIRSVASLDCDACDFNVYALPQGCG
jgi:hypothetical protein